jgi:hypothetical protein
MRTHARSRRRTTYRMSLAMLALAAACTTGAACGGSDGGSTDAFVGRWIKEFDIPVPGDPDASGFDLACTDPNFSMFNTNFLVWSEINFEHGVATDLFEASGNCSLSWDIDGSGKSAIVPNPDPIIGEAPGCVISLNYLDAAQNELPAAMLIEPPTGDAFKFTLLGKNNSGGAPQAELRGTSPVTIQRLDAAGTLFETTTPCSYAGMDTYFRLTQP